MNKQENKMTEQEKDLTAKIMAVTIQIREKHPELSGFLNEMPVTIPDENKPEMNIRVLHEYYMALISLLKKYVEYSEPTEL
jgi:hypothetical protein